MHHVSGEQVCYCPIVSGLMDERGKMLRASWYNTDSFPQAIGRCSHRRRFLCGRPRLTGRHVGGTSPRRGHWNPRASARSGHPQAAATGGQQSHMTLKIFTWEQLSSKVCRLKKQNKHLAFTVMADGNYRWTFLQPESKCPIISCGSE